MTLLEWPDRAAGFLPPDRLDVALTLSPQQGATFRHARVTGYGTFAARAERIAAIRALPRALRLRRRPSGSASRATPRRAPTSGSRSTARAIILMNSPRRPDGPPVRDGKPYSAIAHLAENVTPFVAMAQALRARGLSAPAIFAADRDAGLLVIEDLGNELVVAGDPPAPIEARYEVAVDLLAALHRAPLPDVLPVEPGVDYRAAALRPGGVADRGRTAARLVSAAARRQGVADAKRDAYVALWRDALPPVLEAPRDLGAARFSFAQSAVAAGARGRGAHRPARFPGRGDGAGRLRSRLAVAGCARRRAGDDGDRAAVALHARAAAPPTPASTRRPSRRLYATLAAQRASKILGIFARLERRDGKPQYLRHLPRVWGYLQRSLAHPALAPLAAWYRVNVPALKSL